MADKTDAQILEVVAQDLGTDRIIVKRRGVLFGPGSRPFGDLDRHSPVYDHPLRQHRPVLSRAISAEPKAVIAGRLEATMSTSFTRR
jgi:hypothetical protein